MDVEYFLDTWTPHQPVQTVPPPAREPVEHEGEMWDPESGRRVRHVYVSGFTQFRKRTFSRYSRRARFMTEVMGRLTNNMHIGRVMHLFDAVLAKWKAARAHLERVYFLNVRCVLFLICEHLGIPPPYPKKFCLRDVKRFELQKTLFEKFV